MGISSGFKKYGKQLKASFSLDTENAKRVREENKLNHAEKLALTPVSIIATPLTVIPIGIILAAAGLVALPVGLVGGLLFRKGSTLAAVGLGLLVGGVAATGLGVASPIIDIATIPYNSYKAIKHHHKDKNVPTDYAQEREVNNSHIVIKNVLEKENGHDVVGKEPELLPPVHTAPLFLKKTKAQAQEEIQEVENTVNYRISNSK